jgi:hypothetical protein
MNRQSDLDHLTTLLGQCLGRIDERAFRLQELGDDEVTEDADEVLEQEAATLQELVGSLVDRCETPVQCELNPIVEKSAVACIEELGAPIVLRLRLANDLPPIGCNAGQIAYAIQRALVIAAGRLDVGGELIVTTRRDDDGVVLELESHGGSRDRHLQERSLTLCEFVASMRGHCRVDVHGRKTLLVVLELPQVPAFDES